MALTFGALISDRVDHASDASLDDVDPFTCLMWIKPNTLSQDGRRLFAKANGDDPSMAFLGNSGNLILRWGRATTGLDYRTNDTPLSANVWQFLAFKIDTGAGGNQAGIWVGTLSALASESTYGTSTDGSGALDSNAANSFIVGNRPAANLAFEGDAAFVSFWNVALSETQIHAQQFRPHVKTGCVLFSHYGFNGTGTQPDWSGNGNSGAVTGATVADHVPLGPAFGFDLGWQGQIAAAVAGNAMPLAMDHYRRRRIG